MLLAPPSGTVTFLFTDIEDSTRLRESDSDLMARAVERHDELLGEALGSAATASGGNEAMRAAKFETNEASSSLGNARVIQPYRSAVSASKSPPPTAISRARSRPQSSARRWVPLPAGLRAGPPAFHQPVETVDVLLGWGEVLLQCRDIPALSVSDEENPGRC